MERGIFAAIREWAAQRGIYVKGDVKTQFIKLQEESGELAQAILKNDKEEFIDAIGDMVVVLTNLAHLGDQHFDTRDENGSYTPITIENCIEDAYNQIKDRTGKMENGTFKKD